MHTIVVQEVSQSFVQASVEHLLFEHVNLTFHQKKSYGITGKSGAGKSTLLTIIAGLKKPDRGTVLFDGHDIFLMTESQRHAWFHSTLGVIFQLPYLIDELTVIENVMIKGMIGHHSSEPMTRRQAREHALELLDMVGLFDKKDERPRSLSGGQQQRVSIARALFGKPCFILADEPTGNLDPHAAQAVVDLLINYQNNYGTGLIISSHDPYVIQTMMTRVVIHTRQVQVQDL